MWIKGAIGILFLVLIDLSAFSIHFSGMNNEFLLTKYGKAETLDSDTKRKSLGEQIVVFGERYKVSKMMTQTLNLKFHYNIENMIDSDDLTQEEGRMVVFRRGIRPRTGALDHFLRK